MHKSNTFSVTPPPPQLALGICLVHVLKILFLLCFRTWGLGGQNFQEVRQLEDGLPEAATPEGPLAPINSLPTMEAYRHSLTPHQTLPRAPKLDHGYRRRLPPLHRRLITLNLMDNSTLCTLPQDQRLPLVVDSWSCCIPSLLKWWATFLYGHFYMVTFIWSFIYGHFVMFAKCQLTSLSSLGKAFCWSTANPTYI